MPENPTPTPADVEALMTRIREKSAAIVIQQRKADTVGFKSYGGALGLQALRKDRQHLMGQLPPLMLV